LLEEPETHDVKMAREDETEVNAEVNAEAKAEAEMSRFGLTLFTDGMRLHEWAAAYSVFWRKGRPGRGLKHTGHKLEAYDAESSHHQRAVAE